MLQPFRPQVLDPRIEEPFRKALGHAARAELNEMEAIVAHMSDDDALEAVGLCAFVAAYTAIDICGNSWPNDASLHKIADNTANTGTIVKKTGLTAQDAYDFIARVGIHNEPLDRVFPDPNTAIRTAFVAASSILAAYRPREETIWQFLDLIEDAHAFALGLDNRVLPALMLKAKRQGAHSGVASSGP